MVSVYSKTRQMIAMQVGPRDKQTAEKLFFKLPEPLKKKAIYYTDKFSVYYKKFVWAQYQPVGKESSKSSSIER